MGGFDRLVKQAVLNAITKCGTCGQPYTTDNVEIVGHEEDLWFISLTCRSCRSRGLVAAMIREQKQPALITDLTEKEVAKAAYQEPVVADDVLDMHEFLADFDGDFVSLFERRQAP